MGKELHGFVIFLTLAGLTLGGCQPDATEQADSKSPEGPATPETISPESEGSPPDAAVLAVVAGLKQSNASALWDFLPASYQADINLIVREFAGGMDQQLWDETIKALRTVVELLQTKKDMVLKSPTLANPLQGTRVDTAALADRWDNVVSALEILVSSELTDLEQLKQFDGARFFQGAGTKFMAKLLTAEDRTRFDAVSARTVSVEGDHAELELTDFNGNKSLRPFLRVDGKWVPENMAAEWEQNVTRMRQQIKSLPDFVAQRKPVAMAMLVSINTSLGQALEAQDEKQLMATLLPLIQMAAPKSVPEEAGARGLDLPPTQVVTIRVEDTLDDRVRESISGQLMELVDSRDKARAGIDLLGKDVSFSVGPVSDVAAFAKKIDFLKVLEISADQRIIRAALLKPQ